MKVMKKKKKRRAEGFDDVGASGDGEFQYKSRGKGDWDNQANQTGGNYDPMYKEGIRPFKGKDGENRVRVLPPTWPDAKGFSYTVWWHTNIGPDRQRYLCPAQSNKGTCPICEERNRLAPDVKEGDKEMKEYLYKLSPIKRCVLYLIDRNAEAEGPKIWIAPYKVDRGFAEAAKDPESREYEEIDHPDEGRDIFFKRTGQSERTEYSDYKTSKSRSPVSEDKVKRRGWLKWILAHPIPDQLIWQPADKILKAFRGKSKAEDDAEESSSSGTYGGDDDLDGTPDTTKPRMKKKKKLKKGKIKKKVKKHRDLIEDE